MTPAEAVRHLEEDGYGPEAAQAVTARDPEDVDLTAEDLEDVWRHLDTIEPGNDIADHVHHLACRAEVAEWRAREAENYPRIRRY